MYSNTNAVPINIVQKELYSGMPKSEHPKSELCQKSELLVVQFSARSDFSSSGFNEHGLKTEHSVSTTKA